MFKGMGTTFAAHDENPLEEWDNEMPIDEILDSHNNAMAQELFDRKALAAASAVVTVAKKYGITPELSAVLMQLAVPGAVVPSPTLVAAWSQDQRKAEGSRLADSFTDVGATESLGDKVHTILYHYKVVAMAAMAALNASLVGLKKGTPGQMAARAAISAAVFGGELYLANKIVNRNRVYGSYDVTSATIGEMSQRDDLIKKLQTISIPKEDSDYPQYANELRPLLDTLAGYGYVLADTFISFTQDKIKSSTKFKLEVFSDSGWTPETFKHVATGYVSVGEQIQKQAPALARLADKFDRAVGTVKGQAAAVMLSKLIACLMADQAADGKLVTQSIKSAGRFFSDKQLRVVSA